MGDLRDPYHFEGSLNVLSGARSFSEKITGETVLILIHQKHKREVISRLEKAVQDGISHGADRILILETDVEGYLLPGMMSNILKQAVLERKPSLFLFPLTDILREIAARCAYSCHTGLIADCIDFKYEEDEAVFVCPSFEGEVLADLGFSSDTKTGFVTVQHAAFQKKISTHPLGEMDKMVIKLPTGSNGITCLSHKKEEAYGQNLETAEKIVVGGAGLGNIEGFRKVRELSLALGAETGATRPPILWHWIDDDSLIGQTGKTVKPELLISIGTSGAVQYTAGIKDAKKIVAINRDKNAPIFRLADIGIVADVNQFLPLFTDKIQNRVMRSLADARMSSEFTGTDFGSKLLKIRKARKLSHEELAEKVGRTPDFIEKIESNKTTPSVGFLIKLSEVFGIDPGKFLNEDEKDKLSGKRAKEYTRRTSNYHYQTLTPDAENEHLRVFLVTIEPKKSHKPVAYRHDGEEFIYVMEGKLELTLREKAHILMTGESLKFNSDTPHKLKSMGNEKTKCLVTLYTP